LKKKTKLNQEVLKNEKSLKIVMMTPSDLSQKEREKGIDRMIAGHCVQENT